MIEREPPIPYTQIIMTVCNDFCWQTWDEILASAEYVDDRVEQDTLRITLFRLERAKGATRLTSRHAPGLWARRPGRYRLKQYMKPPKNKQ